MRYSILILFVYLHLNVIGQSYSFQQIEDSSLAVIERQVGIELADYFELPPDNMYITYENWFGKNKIKWIEPGNDFKTKRLKEVSLFLIFKHPNLPSSDNKISFFINFNKELQTADSFDLFKIPAFIREGRPNDWLTLPERQKITDTLTFEKKVMKVLTSITYVPESRQYYFEVRNLYDSKEGYYYYENYWISVTTSNIEKHFYTKSYVCSML